MHIVAIAMVSTFFSCVDSEKDLYDPSYQTSNPMGEGFTAPEGFDWAMTTAKTVTVEVNDEYLGAYFYTIEIYDENPLSNANAPLLAKGTAKKGQNFVASINIPQGQLGFFVKQTDPKGRVEVYPFSVPEDSNNITCKLYYTEAQSSALKTRTALATTRATTIEKPNYTSVPSNAIEITSSTGNLQPNTSYKITSTYSGTLTYYGNSSNVKLYVDAKWDVPQDFTFQSGIEVIVMGNGKIVASSHNIQFNGASMMTIMDNGTVSVNNITFSNGSPAGLRSWGTLTVADAITLSSGASLYNLGVLTSKSFTASSNSQIINNTSFAITGDITLPSNFTLENNGTITGNKLTGNSSSTITNNNVMTLNEISLNNTTVYNNCSMEAKTTFSARGCTITLEKGYMKGNNIVLGGTTVNLKNGSMVEAVNQLDLESWSAHFIATGTNPSLIKAASVIGHGFSYYGNLAIESNNHVKNEQYTTHYTADNGAHLAAIGESKILIEVCTGTKNGGNGGTDPTNPTFPIIVDDNHQYTYTFEDQWPLYGDYDMNDVVMTIKNRQYKLNSDNKVQEFTFSINLDAVGATKSIAAAIMFDAIPASAISQAVVLGNSNLVKSFSLSNKNIENGQDYAVVPLFDNAHAALGSSKYEPINTVNGYASNTTAKNITFTMKFDTPSLTTEAFIIEKLNLFIIVEGNSSKRREIHVVKYPPTKLANTDLFGGNNDASSVSGKKYYISKENLAWAVVVPTSFKWAVEFANMKTVYPKFTSWVTSGGTENQNWWSDFNESKVFQTNKN